MSHFEHMTATLLQHVRRLAAVWCGTLALALVAAIYIARVGSVGHGEMYAVKRAGGHAYLGFPEGVGSSLWRDW